MIKDDGDIVRGLGFVAMHSAHLEGRIDELLFHLSGIEEFTEKAQRWPISNKIKRAKKTLGNIHHPLASEICKDLDLCKEHFEWRNELVHGRIYAPEYHEENLKSSRPNVPDRKATSEELYTLANNLVELDSRVYRPMIIQIHKVLSDLTNKDV